MSGPILNRLGGRARHHRPIGARTLAPAVVVFVLTVSVAADPPPARAEEQPDSLSAVAELHREATALKPLVKSRLARDFLDATTKLPRIAPRKLLHDSTRTHYYTPADASMLPDSVQARLLERRLDEGFYYYTRYGSPLAYVRALEILAGRGFERVENQRIADFGYGTIGHLKLLASLGADVTGIDVDPLLERLYSAPEDRTALPLHGERAGRIDLVHGHFPAEEATVRQVGSGYHLFLSKNTLKNGYIHPEQPVDKRMLVDLGVDDTTYVRTIFRLLEPGGSFMIYNLTPAPNGPGKPYRPMADGRSPFSRALLESAGFRVLAPDRDDGEAARAMGHALGWDQGEGRMDLANDLFATWTLARKPSR